MTLLAVTSETWIVTGLGFCMVLVLLFVFVYIMKLLGFIMRDRSKDAPKKAAVPSVAPSDSASIDADMAAVAMALHLNESDEDMAAVAMALHLYNNERLSAVPQMTLQGHATAWNNKIFGLNNINK